MARNNRPLQRQEEQEEKKRDGYHFKRLNLLFVGSTGWGWTTTVYSTSPSFGDCRLSWSAKSGRKNEQDKKWTKSSSWEISRIQVQYMLQEKCK